MVITNMLLAADKESHENWARACNWACIYELHSEMSHREFYSNTMWATSFYNPTVKFSVSMNHMQLKILSETCVLTTLFNQIL